MPFWRPLDPVAAFRADSKDKDLARALIINGNEDGTVNKERYTEAYANCKKLGYDCVRTKGMYIDMWEYQNVCGAAHADKKRWGRTEEEFKSDRYMRGVMFAHRVALEYIARQAEGIRHIIFEDDFVLGDRVDKDGKVLHKSDTQQAVDFSKDEIAKFLNEDDNKIADVAYIGHAHRGWHLHAYAWTPEGARKALVLVDWCQTNRGLRSPIGTVIPLDVILGGLCWRESMLSQDNNFRNVPEMENGVVRAHKEGNAHLKCVYANNGGYGQGEHGGLLNAWKGADGGGERGLLFQKDAGCTYFAMGGH